MNTLSNVKPFCLTFTAMLWIVATFPVSLLAQSDPPAILVEVDIQADLYLSELGDEIAGIEQHLEQFLAGNLSANSALGFVRWTTDDMGTQHGLKLVIESVTGGLGTEVRGRFHGRIEGTETDLSGQSLEHFQPVLFDAFAQKYAQDPDRLQQELKQVLSTHMNESFVDALNIYFLNNVPLTSAVEVDDIGRRLIVPLRYSAINPERESRLRVEFTSTQIGNARDGTMNLSMAGKGRMPHFEEDGLDCEIASFKYPTITTSSAEDVLDRWDAIRSVLDEDNLVELMLYMEEYIPSFFANTTGRLAMDMPPSP